MDLNLILFWIFSIYVYMLDLFDIFEFDLLCVKSGIMMFMFRRIVLRVNEIIYLKLLV